MALRLWVVSKACFHVLTVANYPLAKFRRIALKVFFWSQEKLWKEISALSEQWNVPQFQMFCGNTLSAFSLHIRIYPFAVTKLQQTVTCNRVILFKRHAFLIKALSSDIVLIDLEEILFYHRRRQLINISYDRVNYYLWAASHNWSRRWTSFSVCFYLCSTCIVRLIFSVSPASSDRVGIHLFVGYRPKPICN